MRDLPAAVARRCRRHCLNAGGASDGTSSVRRSQSYARVPNPTPTDAKVFGVFIDTPQAGMRVGYLTEAQPSRPILSPLPQPARPAEVLRIAVALHGRRMRAFRRVRLQTCHARHQHARPGGSGLPRCVIRPTCRWFRQEGRAACLRCPQVVTELRHGTDLQRQVAGAAITQ